MNLLIDTHALIWFITDNDKLPPPQLNSRMNNDKRQQQPVRELPPLVGGILK